ncbi:cuticle-degrading protease [Lentithecium fluviatile CBS 122367]|uniref:Cuticle-degrading protease n=1 Tax=Lentithecium fluviatile CBS 122367 TaxID=1168545 RepID=A0A6G1IP84_9PLEO|nr:cuticle-degrading protease [Lentithecium fluviatile CBS 122367]
MKAFVILLGVCAITAHGAAPILGPRNGKALLNNYIVVLKESISTEAFASHLESASAGLRTAGDGAAPNKFDFGTFKGYTIKASNDEVTALAKSDDISFIEADRTFTLPPVSKTRVSPRVVQTNAPWNLARISHRQSGSTEYVYQPTTGTFVYILDTGVKVTHQAFQGRASFGFNAVGGSNEDANGHGTHLAGIVSSQTYGVVRFAGIISVKVLGDSGSSTISTIISGINWTVQDIQSKSRIGKATALLAVGGSFSAALNNAVAAASNAGVMFAVAAGGENANAVNYSPSSEPTACTVGASTIGDARASSSNYGAIIDIFAPGQNILSVWITSDTSTATLSGTSMAAAHIAGLGAYFLALEGPRGAVALCERMREVATRDVLSGIPSGSANLLAYNLSGL